MSTTIVGPDGKSRCRWCGAAPEFLDYHDTEWGFPVSDDHRLFEKLSLESFQSGLSWRTILAKRENFRAAFHEFRLRQDSALHRARPRSSAQGRRDRPPSRQDRGGHQQRTTAQELVKREGSLAAFIWRYEPDMKQLANRKPHRPRRNRLPCRRT